jgi:hypothetical protein
MTYFRVPTTEALVNRVWALGLPLTIYLSLLSTKHVLKVESALINKLRPIHHNINKKRQDYEGSEAVAAHFLNPTFGGELFCEQTNHA